MKLRSRFASLTPVPWRVGTICFAALAFGEFAAAAIEPPTPLVATWLAMLVSALAGALGGAAVFDALSPLLPAASSAATVGRHAAAPSSIRLEASSAWNFDYREAEPDEAWSSDSGRSQVAWAEATLAARDAWERAARISRTRVVLGKRVILGDPPPRSGDDT
jgi:hypothetical protein